MTSATEDALASALDGAITVRRLRFEFPADLDPVLVEGRPEESFMHVGISALLPHLEPYLIRSMRSAKPHVRDEKLLADLEAFSGQEGQHYRQHLRFNEAMRLERFAGLREAQEDIEADYRRFTRTKSLRFNLAYAEGFEAFTTALSRFSFETGLLESAPAERSRPLRLASRRGAGASNRRVRRLRPRLRRVRLSRGRQPLRAVALESIRPARRRGPPSRRPRRVS